MAAGAARFRGSLGRTAADNSRFVYAVVVVITDISVSIQLAVPLPLLGAVFTALLGLRDPTYNTNERDWLFLLSTTSVVAMVSTALGVAVILSICLSPGLPSVLLDHNQLRSWKIDFEALGLPREEVLDRLKLGTCGTRHGSSPTCSLS